jgi:hypothetical protein
MGGRIGLRRSCSPGEEGGMNRRLHQQDSCTPELLYSRLPPCKVPLSFFNGLHSERPAGFTD